MVSTSAQLPVPERDVKEPVIALPAPKPEEAPFVIKLMSSIPG